MQLIGRKVNYVIMAANIFAKRQYVGFNHKISYGIEIENRAV